MISAARLGHHTGFFAGAMLLVAAVAPAAAAQTTCSATLPSGAPTCGVTLNATVNVAHLLQLTVSGGAQTTLASPVVTTYDSSATAASVNEYPVGATGPLLTVKANRGWQLTIKAQNAYFTFAKDATYALCRPGDATGTCTGSSSSPLGKQAGDLAWSLNAATSFAGVGTTAATVSSSAAGSSASYTIYFRAKWLYATDVPGTYTLPVIYTITGQ
jgi:hypothetical protein